MYIRTFTRLRVMLYRICSHPHIHTPPWAVAHVLTQRNKKQKTMRIAVPMHVCACACCVHASEHEGFSKKPWLMSQPHISRTQAGAASVLWVYAMWRR